MGRRRHTSSPVEDPGDTAELRLPPVPTLPTARMPTAELARRSTIRRPVAGERTVIKVTSKTPVAPGAAAPKQRR